MDDFEPAYLVTLDEIYHGHWAAKKKRRIGFMREAFRHFWPRGHPSRLIHITGTNGKGSTAHYLAQGLRFAGHTGTWTSPHVFDYAERFHLNGKPATHAEITEIYREVLAPYQQEFMAAHGEESLSFAELGILLALHLFERHTVTWAVMEVGAGGRYTPLMALPMAACVLTNVGEDHPKTLGAHLWQRVLEKAGIARHGIPFFTSAAGATLPMVLKAAQAEGAVNFAVEETEIADVEKLFSRVQPNYKLRNLALACKLIRHFYPGMSVEKLVANMKENLPARFWQVSPQVIADVAHNPDKVEKLAEHLALTFPGKSFHFLVGLTRSRDPRRVFGPLLPMAERLVVTSASYAGQNPEQVAAALRPVFPEVEAHSDPSQAYQQACEGLGNNDMLVVTGSAYLIDQALNPNPYLGELNAAYGWRGASLQDNHGSCPSDPDRSR